MVSARLVDDFSKPQNNTIQKIMAVSKSSIFQKRKTADTHIYHSELVYLLHILAI